MNLKNNWEGRLGPLGTRPPSCFSNLFQASVPSLSSPMPNPNQLQNSPCSRVVCMWAGRREREGGRMGLKADGSVDESAASTAPTLGAANDGDGDRNLIAGWVAVNLDIIWFCSLLWSVYSDGYLMPNFYYLSYAGLVVLLLLLIVLQSSAITGKQFLISKRGAVQRGLQDRCHPQLHLILLQMLWTSLYS